MEGRKKKRHRRRSSKVKKIIWSKRRDHTLHGRVKTNLMAWLAQCFVIQQNILCLSQTKYQWHKWGVEVGKNYNRQIFVVWIQASELSFVLRATYCLEKIIMTPALTKQFLFSSSPTLLLQRYPKTLLLNTYFCSKVLIFFVKYNKNIFSEPGTAQYWVQMYVPQTSFQSPSPTIQSIDVLL